MAIEKFIRVDNITHFDADKENKCFYLYLKTGTDFRVTFDSEKKFDAVMYHLLNGRAWTEGSTECYCSPSNFFVKVDSAEISSLPF